VTILFDGKMASACKRCSTPLDEKDLDEARLCLGCAIEIRLREMCRNVRSETAQAITQMAEEGRYKLYAVKKDGAWFVVEDASEFELLLRCPICREMMEFRGSPTETVARAEAARICEDCRRPRESKRV